MSKKLQNNGLFESSRMMLPEHKEVYLEHQRRIQKTTKPALDVQETERMSRLIADSLLTRTPIVLVLFRDGEERRVRGHVERIDHPQRRLLLTGENTDAWIAMADIVKAGE